MDTTPELPSKDDLYEHHKIVVDKGQNPLRIDKYLMNFIENATRNKIQAAAKDGSIFVNDIAVKSNYKVKPFDVIRVKFEHPPFENLLVGEDIPLDIVYEDDDLLVVNKPAGIVVHPGHGNYSGTLINALIFHFENLPKNSSDRPGLVHRIDKDTSGLLVVAKTEHAMAHLSKQFKDKTTLDALAENEEFEIETASAINQRNPSIVGAGNEPYIVGVAFAMEEGTLSNLITGEYGVYKVLLMKKNTAEELEDYTAYTEQMMTELSARITENVFKALESVASIDDNRALYY